VLLHRTLQGALVIPQRAVFEILEKQFVWVVGQDGVVHPREIVVENELEDIFVIKSGLNTSDRFVIDGVQQVHDGLHVKPEFQEPEEVLANLKYHAE
jgi:membrane fusion protein (multidrug efflux system)